MCVYLCEGALCGSVCVWVRCEEVYECAFALEQRLRNGCGFAPEQRLCAYAHVRTYARGGGRVGSVRHEKKKTERERQREREKKERTRSRENKKKEKMTDRESE